MSLHLTHLIISSSFRIGFENVGAKKISFQRGYYHVMYEMLWSADENSINLKGKSSRKNMQKFFEVILDKKIIYCRTLHSNRRTVL